MPERKFFLLGTCPKSWGHGKTHLRVRKRRSCGPHVAANECGKPFRIHFGCGRLLRRNHQDSGCFPQTMEGVRRRIFLRIRFGLNWIPLRWKEKQWNVVTFGCTGIFRWITWKANHYLSFCRFWVGSFHNVFEAWGQTKTNWVSANWKKWLNWTLVHATRSYISVRVEILQLTRRIYWWNALSVHHRE